MSLLYYFSKTEVRRDKTQMFFAAIVKDLSLLAEMEHQ